MRRLAGKDVFETNLGVDKKQLAFDPLVIRRGIRTLSFNVGFCVAEFDCRRFNVTTIMSQDILFSESSKIMEPHIGS